tara:strand:- start:2769 stop:4790 length:2022 start_codon:yes stop_codon:yes gene_type:complete
MATGNVYGVQRVDEPEVRDGLDIAASSASLAAQGAQAGATLGPWGAVGGAVAGFGMGVAGGVAGQAREQRTFDKAEGRNEFVEDLEGRGLRTNKYVRAQAKDGMKLKNKYETVEIEGDGSGAVDGIGEIHVDKNYNIKNIAKGARRHEDGGFKIDDLKEDDVIFPTQNSEKEYNRVMGAIKRWKLNGDSRAKKFLDSKSKALPTDVDYGYDTEGKKYAEGKGTGSLMPKDQLSEIMKNSGITDLKRRDIRMMSDEQAMEKVAQYMSDPKIAGENQAIIDASKADSDTSMADSTKAAAWDQLFDKKDSWNPKTIKEHADKYGLDYTDIGAQAKKRNVTIPGGALGAGSQNRDANWGPKTAAYFSAEPGDKGTTPRPPMNADGTYNKIVKTPYAEKKKAEVKAANVNTVVDNSTTQAPVADNTTVDPTASQIAKPAAQVVDPGVANAELEANKLARAEADAARKAKADELWNEVNAPEANHSNPLKYASMIHKGAMGQKDIDKVERRFVKPGEHEYEDRSYVPRRNTVEQRNFERSNLRGKGLSAGQNQAYQNQSGSRYLSANEAINEREAIREDKVDAANVGIRNSAEMTNLGLANQYDTFDEQAEAAKQKYTDESMSDMSKLAQVNEQGKYTRAKNRRQRKMSQATATMIGTGDFGYDADNPLYGVKYKKGSY